MDRYSNIRSIFLLFCFLTILDFANRSCITSKCFPELNLSRQSSVKAVPLYRLQEAVYLGETWRTMRHHIHFVIYIINGVYKPCTRYNLLGGCTSTDKVPRGPFESPSN